MVSTVCGRHCRDKLQFIKRVYQVMKRQTYLSMSLLNIRPTFSRYIPRNACFSCITDTRTAIPKSVSLVLTLFLSTTPTFPAVYSLPLLPWHRAHGLNWTCPNQNAVSSSPDWLFFLPVLSLQASSSSTDQVRNLRRVPGLFVSFT